MRKESHDNLLFNWLGSNVSKKGINKLLREINNDSFYDDVSENRKKPESEQLQNIKKVMRIMAGPT